MTWSLQHLASPLLLHLGHGSCDASNGLDDAHPAHWGDTLHTCQFFGLGGDLLESGLDGIFVFQDGFVAGLQGEERVAKLPEFTQQGLLVALDVHRVLHVQVENAGADRAEGAEVNVMIIDSYLTKRFLFLDGTGEVVGYRDRR